MRVRAFGFEEGSRVSVAEAAHVQMKIPPREIAVLRLLRTTLLVPEWIKMNTYLQQ